MRIISDYYESSPPKKFPFAVALVIAAVCQVFSRILGKGFLSSISVENIIDYRNGLFFDYQKARTILGFQSKMVFKEEIVRAIKDYENQKKY
jgi:nucleoside-diphosphate-sugar epimerase